MESFFSCFFIYLKKLEEKTFFPRSSFLCDCKKRSRLFGKKKEIGNIKTKIKILWRKNLQRFYLIIIF